MEIVTGGPPTGPTTTAHAYMVITATIAEDITITTDTIAIATATTVAIATTVTDIGTIATTAGISGVRNGATIAIVDIGAGSLRRLLAAITLAARAGLGEMFGSYEPSPAFSPCPAVARRRGRSEDALAISFSDKRHAEGEETAQKPTG